MARLTSTGTRALLATGFLIASVVVGMAASGETGNGSETIEVKRSDTKDPKHASLQFLRDNRAFLRAQLDRLRQTRHSTSDDAMILDERMLRLQEMSEALAAARDTVRLRDDAMAQRAILKRVTELGSLVDELTQMERTLTEQRGRLLTLEGDFLGHQETALVILIRGLGGSSAPDAIVLSEDDDVTRVELTPEQRASLEQGGIAQVYHEFVEPREHTIDVTLAGSAWHEAAPVAVVLETSRDRLTFLELDASHLERGAPTSGLATRVWYR
jgi:hypothetical protein